MQRRKPVPIELSRREAVTGGLALGLLPTRASARAPLSGRLIPVRDTRLWVEDYGPRDAPALLYVHGGPGLGVFEFSHYMRDQFTDLRLILIDQRGVLRKKWLIENGPTTVVYSETLLRDIRDVMGKR